MNVYDAHVHFLWREPPEQAGRAWVSLGERGLRGMAVIIMGSHLADRSRCLALIPRAYHHRVDPAFFDEPPDLSRCVPRTVQGLPVFPYLDSRYMETDRADLRPFRDAGFRGLKILYIPEEDRDYGMLGWKKLFGRSLRDSEKLIADLVGQASGFGWPVIFHADLRKYGPFVEDVLASHSKTRFILPHFGFSRKAVSGILERLDYVYTDFSSLLPFMQKAPEAYKGFVEDHAGRILFGSDATVGWPGLIGEYMDAVRGMIRNEHVLRQVLETNYLRIHGGPADA